MNERWLQTTSGARVSLSHISIITIESDVKVGGQDEPRFALRATLGNEPQPRSVFLAPTHHDEASARTMLDLIAPPMDMPAPSPASGGEIDVDVPSDRTDACLHGKHIACRALYAKDECACRCHTDI